MIRHGVYLQGFCKGQNLPATLEMLNCAALSRRQGDMSRDDLGTILSVPRWLIGQGVNDDVTLSAAILRGARRQAGFSMDGFRPMLQAFSEKEEQIESVVCVALDGQVAEEYPCDAFACFKERMLSSKGLYLLGVADGMGSQLVRDGLFFCMEAHAGARRITGEAYSEHPIRATINLINAGVRDETTLCAEENHDVLEDTDTTKEELRDHFGEEVAIVDDLLSKKRRISREEYFEGIASDWRAVLCKAADRVDNAASIAFAYPTDKKIEYVAETLLILAIMKRTRRWHLASSDALVVLRDRIVDIIGHVEEIIRLEQKADGLARENKELKARAMPIPLAWVPRLLKRFGVA